MPTMEAIQIPFFPSPESILQVMGNECPSFFLDSSSAHHPRSRYSYAGIRPSSVFTGLDDPWVCLASVEKVLMKVAPESHFTGGLVGYFSYENFQHVDPFQWKAKGGAPLPPYWLAWFDAILVLDHQAERCFVASSFLNAAELQIRADEWIRTLQACNRKINSPVSQPRDLHHPTLENFSRKVERIKDYLARGDIYQVNLTERFESETEASSPDLYRKLRHISPVPYGAFLNAGDFQVLSVSPELFFNMDGKGNIETRPIKGTRKRVHGPDHESRQELLASPKDRAELLMIVDLERNDLGRICQYGSVKVESLYEVESFEQVHHLVATVTGKLQQGITPLKALKALFPGGSVTGAPKKRAMEIIEELESVPRSVYTGALGYLGAGGMTQMNMPIRTLLKKGKQVFYHAGCGIVIDSDPRSEYEEMMVKALAMRLALEA